MPFGKLYIRSNRKGLPSCSPLFLYKLVRCHTVYRRICFNSCIKEKYTKIIGKAIIVCTRLVYHGNNIITGFNFDIDLSAWNHRVIEEKERFYIGILRPDGIYHSYHGVNQNGNVGTLLYVYGNPAGAFRDSPDYITIADLAEQFIKARISFDDALRIIKTKKIIYALDATMQAMLSDAHGRVLIIEPGIGYREEHKKYSLITNYSLLKPKSTSV